MLVPPPPVPVLPPDLLPPVILSCSVNMLAGASGTGKTAFLAWWVRQLQLHQPIFGLDPGPVPVFQGIIAADRSWDVSTRRWFDLQGCDPLPHYSLQDDRAFRKANLRKKHDRISIFRDCLSAVRPTGLTTFPARSVVYVDPLALFLGGNLLDYDTCMVACCELREICLEQGVTLIGTAHAAKQKADKGDRYLRLQDRILGSAALYGYTDTQLYLASPEEVGKDHYIFLWSPHHAKSQLFELTRDDEGRFVPKAECVDSNGRTVVPDDVDWLLVFLEEAHSWTEIRDMAKAQGMSKSSVQRRLKVLQETGQVATVGRGTYQIPRVQ